MRSRLLLVMVLLLLTPLSALPAGRLAEFDVTCPLFGHEFKAQSLVRDDPVSAYDSDFCKRSLGESSYVLAVWTCPYCFFSAYQADFRGSLDPKFRDMELKSYPLDPEKVEQKDIFVATKYFNAETYYRTAGRDAKFLADLTLRGSYATRVFRVEDDAEYNKLRHKQMEEALGGKKILGVEEANLELVSHVDDLFEEGKVPEASTSVYRYLRADALRQAGERLQAKAIFDELIADRGLSARYQRNAAQQSFLCVKEGEFQEKTLDYLHQAVKEGLIAPSEMPRATYLMGELNRRLGNYDEARVRYQEAAGMDGVEDFLRTMIEKQQARLLADVATGEGR